MNINEYPWLRLSFIVIVLAQLAACKSDEGKPGPREDTGILYLDYGVWGDEERNMVTLTLRYRKEDADGDPVLLSLPAGVTFDGEELLPDSSVMNGVYYETSTSVPDFEGVHQIVFTDKSGQIYTEEFSFSPMILRSELPAVLPGNELIVELGGIDSGEHIHVVMTDTSFYGPGIDKIDTVRNGRLVISGDELKKLKSGPVFLELYQEEKRPLQSSMAAGGIMTRSYNIKRTFDLQHQDN